MTIVARVRSWLRAVLQRRELERGMDAEMALHLELYEADLRRSGVPPADARRRARAEFGSVEARQDECREAVGLRLLNDLRSDVVYALRLLRRSPAFAVVALLSLGLGIGANTAIFSLVDTVLLRTLPVAEPHRLFFVDNTGGRTGGSNGPPYPCFELLRDNNRFMSGLAAFSGDMFRVTIDSGAPERVRGQSVSGNYFDLLGVRAVHGRVLTPQDDSVFGQGGPDGAVAVISHGFWKRRFGSDPAVLGKTIQVGTRPVTIVGVTEPEFFGLSVGSPIEISMPMMLAGSNVKSRTTWWMSTVGRLKPDATIDQARADLEALWDGYMNDLGQPREKRGGFSGIALVPALKGLDGVRRQYSEPLLIIMVIVGLVLLIGCANVATLLLARASARRNEMAVRLAIGAGRARLVRQLVTEGLVFVVLGSVMGLLFARWGVTFIAGLFARGGEGILLDPRFDLRILAFTGAVAALTALLFSLAPAFHATRPDAAKPLAFIRSVGPSRLNLGQPLVVIQVTLSVVLLCGAALFMRSLANLTSVDLGYRRSGVLMTSVEASMPANPPPKTPEEMRNHITRLGAMWEAFAARMSATPGVRSASVSMMIPTSGFFRGVGVALIDGGIRRGRQDGGTALNHVTEGYFETVGIRLVAGRVFTPQDRAGSLRVVVLNETAARGWFGTESPIGKKLNFPGQRVEDPFEIIGVVGDARYRSPRDPDFRRVYVPIGQAIDPITRGSVAVRGPGDVTSLAAAIRAAAADTIPGAFIPRVATVEERLKDSLVRERLLSILASFFGALALVLACIGLYGVMAYAVVRRTREIGIRLAIGARPGSVVWMVLRDTLALIFVGALLGTTGAQVLSRYLDNQLFGVHSGDPMTTTAAILVLVFVTVAAGYLPARRASRIDPVIALRYE